MSLYRRRFLANTAGAALGAGVVTSCARGPGKGAPRVVVIGGGYGGATCARYIRYFDPDVNVTLVEMRTHYQTCPFSNAVLGGIEAQASTIRDYAALKNNYGVDVVHAEARTIDPEKRVVTLADGSVLPYQRLVISPGISFLWEHIFSGYDEAASSTMPMPGTAVSSLPCSSNSWSLCAAAASSPSQCPARRSAVRPVPMNGPAWPRIT